MCMHCLNLDVGHCCGFQKDISTVLCDKHLQEKKKYKLNSKKYNSKKKNIEFSYGFALDIY